MRFALSHIHLKGCLCVNDNIVCFYSGGARIALKIIKSNERYREAALSEVEVLEQINSIDCDRR